MPDFALPDDALDGLTAGLREVEVADPDPVAEAPAAELGAPEPSAEAPPAPAAPPAHTLSEDEWRAWETYRQLDQRLQTDGEFAERFRQVFAPPPPPPAPAAPAQPEAPSYLAGDPGWQQVVTQLASIREEQARHAALLNARAQAENQAALNRASASFRESHGLDEATFAKVYDRAQDFASALPTFAQRGVPLDQALGQILESAYWSMPEMREADAARHAAEVKAASAKKAKAGSLSGSSGSVPRSATRAGPRSEAESRADMVAYMNDFLASGGGVE